jgi:hypothetical protein
MGTVAPPSDPVSPTNVTQQKQPPTTFHPHVMGGLRAMPRKNK